MKYYKITLGVANDGQIGYPTNYQSEIGDYALDHLYYDDADGSKLLLVLPDTVTNIVRKNVEEITEKDALDISEANEKREEVVTNDAVVRRLDIKVRLGEKLSGKELLALDPTSDEPGFGTSKILSDRVAKLKNK